MKWITRGNMKTTKGGLKNEEDSVLRSFPNGFRKFSDRVPLRTKISRESIKND